MLKMITEKVSGITMDKYLDTEFYKRLGARHTFYNPLHHTDTMRIAPTENDGFVRRQLLRGYVHDEAAAFQGGVSAAPRQGQGLRRPGREGGREGRRHKVKLH